jgi:hypothetical protein
MAEVPPGAAAPLVAAMAEESALVRLRHERGCRSFAVCLGDEVAAYGWVSRAPEWIGEIRLELRPAPDEAYVWNCVTLPAHRRSGMFGALLVDVSRRMRSENVTRLWIAEAGGGAVPALPPAGFAPVLELHESRAGHFRRLGPAASKVASSAAVTAALRALSLDGRPSFGRLPPARRH